MDDNARIVCMCERTSCTYPEHKVLKIVGTHIMRTKKKAGSSIPVTSFPAGFRSVARNRDESERETTNDYSLFFFPAFGCLSTDDPSPHLLSCTHTDREGQAVTASCSSRVSVSLLPLLLPDRRTERGKMVSVTPSESLILLSCL